MPSNEIAFIQIESLSPLLFQSAAGQHARIYAFDMRRLDGRDIDSALTHSY